MQKRCLHGQRLSQPLPHVPKPRPSIGFRSNLDSEDRVGHKGGRVVTCAQSRTVSTVSSVSSNRRNSMHCVPHPRARLSQPLTLRACSSLEHTRYSYFSVVQYYAQRHPTVPCVRRRTTQTCCNLESEQGNTSRSPSDVGSLLQQPARRPCRVTLGTSRSRVPQPDPAPVSDSPYQSSAPTGVATDHRVRRFAVGSDCDTAGTPTAVCTATVPWQLSPS